MPSLNLKNLDADWYKKIKILAATEGVTVREFVIRAVTQYLAKRESKHAAA